MWLVDCDDQRARRRAWRAATAWLALTLPAAATFAADIEGSRDHSLMSRYEGSEIIGYDQREFDQFALFVKPAENYGGIAKNAASTRSLEGTVTHLTYRAPAERTTLEVFRNYEAALADAGFETVFTCKNEACGGRNFSHAAVAEHNYMAIGESYGDQRYLAARLERDEGEIYVSLYVAFATVGGGANYQRVIAQLDVVELAPMEARMVTVDAGRMASEIAESGRIALYGIYFDTDKAELKPESRPALDEIAKLLAGNPDLRLVVVGHTDNVGSLDYNMTLSRRRAGAVESALVADYGIAAARLESWGVGYLAPVASNQSAEGRALNRRVELVER
jgi:outer membrane protein OmpA-like peptidoglycan-associated protein